MEQRIDLHRVNGSVDLRGVYFFERRRAARQETKDGFITITGVHVSAATTRLRNICRQGLAFDHISPQPIPQKELEVSLLVTTPEKKEDLFLYKVKAEILSIGEISGSWGPRGGRARHYSLRFVDLTQQQKYFLLNFLGEARELAIGTGSKEQSRTEPATVGQKKGFPSLALPYQSPLFPAQGSPPPARL